MHLAGSLGHVAYALFQAFPCPAVELESLRANVAKDEAILGFTLTVAEVATGRHMSTKKALGNLRFALYEPLKRLYQP